MLNFIKKLFFIIPIILSYRLNSMHPKISQICKITQVDILEEKLFNEIKKLYKFVTPDFSSIQALIEKGAKVNKLANEFLLLLFRHIRFVENLHLNMTYDQNIFDEKKYLREFEIGLKILDFLLNLPGLNLNRCLEKSNIDIDELEDHEFVGNTILNYAIYNAVYPNDIDVIERILLNQNFDINIKDASGNTAILYAILDKNLKTDNDISLKIIDLLLLRDDINLFLKNKSGKNALDLIKREKEIYENYENISFKIIIQIYEKLINKLNFWRLKLFESIEKNDYRSFKRYLIKLGSSVKDPNGNNILHHAIKYKNIEFMKIIIALNPGLLNQKNKLNLMPTEYALQNVDSGDPKDILILILNCAYKK